MKPLFCFLLLITGLNGILRVCKTHQYHFVKEPKNWDDARSYCREMYTDLATVGNMDEIQRLKTDANAIDSWVWMGLHRGDERTWKWSLTDSATCEKNDFTAWENGSQQDRTYVFSENGMWRSDEEEDIHAFICFDRSRNDYILCDEKKTWKQAQRHCREHHTDLASVRNKTENRKITEAARGESVWIGLFRDSWKWSDGSHSSLRNWAEAEPNSQSERCVEALFKHKTSPTGLWNDRDCSNLSPFVCHLDVNEDIILIRENKTWAEALSHCRGNYHDLVSVHNEDVQKWVAQEAKTADSPYVWLGLRYTCTLDYWFWVSGQSLCYQNWAPGNGSGWQECGMTGAIEKGGDQRWVDRSDMEELNFICMNTDEH